MITRLVKILIGLAFVVAPLSVRAERFVLQNGTDSVVGELRSTYARADDTLIDIAREFDLGYDQIVSANIGVNRWIPGDGTRVLLPHLYVLPGSTRRGLVLNIADLRLYYYPSPQKGSPQEVFIYPVSIGRMDWRTPLGLTRVTSKERDPAWRPPKSIQIEHAREGEILPAVIRGGDPENPLGRFALRLGIPSYLIHGVDERKAFGIGMRVTHGCIRMYPEDIEQLFGLVSVNTPLLLIDEPVKVGQRDGRIYLSVHQPLDEREDEDAPSLPRVSLDRVLSHLKSQVGNTFDLDSRLIAEIAERGDGIPYEIGQGYLITKAATSKQPAQTTQPSRMPKTLDTEYEEAVAKYLKETPAPRTPPSSSEGRRIASSEVREVQRRAPLASTDSAEDDRVRQYLEERY